MTPWTVCGQPGSSVHGSLQARTVEWVAVPFSRASSQTRGQICISHPLLHWQVGSLPLVPPGKPKDLAFVSSLAKTSPSFYYFSWKSCFCFFLGRMTTPAIFCSHICPRLVIFNEPVQLLLLLSIWFDHCP